MTEPGARTTVREAAFAIFAHFGVNAIFGNPGSTELPMLRALPDSFDYVLGLNEAVVAGMADGYARASGLPALVNLHAAAGVGHALGNLFTAFRNGAPLVVTAGQQARSLLPFDPFLHAERATEFPRPYVKWASEPARAEDVPQALIRAFQTALTPPMGPCFVSIPVDDWDRECVMPMLPSLHLRTMGDPAGIEQLRVLLDNAKRPALILGSGLAASRDARAAATVLAERSGADVWAAPYAARETIAEDHPRFAGFLPAFRAQLLDRLAPYDALLVAGAPVFTWHAEGEGPFWPSKARLGVLSDDPQHLAALPGGIGVLGDIGAGLSALAAAVATRAAVPPPLPRPSPPLPGMTAAHVLCRIAVLRPQDSVLVEEAPTARDAMHDHLPVVTKGGFFTTASGGLGHALPAAVGIARADPSRRVLALLGDGSAMYCIQGLWSAASQGAKVSFLILDNGGYAALAQFAGLFGMNHIPGTRLEGIDFVAQAAGLGVPGQRVSDLNNLDAALAWAMTTDGPSLLQIMLD